MRAADDYAKAMVAGNDAECARIELMYGLYGYPPEIVSVGLAAVDEGRCQHDAVDEYTGEEQ